MDKEEILKRARHDHHGNDPRRQMLERKAGAWAFYLLYAIIITWKTIEWVTMKTFGAATIRQNTFPLSDILFAFVSLGVAFTHFFLFFQMRKARHLFLAIFFALMPIIFCWRIFS